MSEHFEKMIFAHVQSCEEALLDPQVRRDRARGAALLADDFQEFGSSGRTWSRAQIVEVLASEDFHKPAMEDFKCDLIGEGVALVTYRTVGANSESGPDQGRKSASLRSSIWVMEGEVWRVRFHQGTKAL